MELGEAIENRRSIRRYQDRKVHKDLVGRILEAGMWAPSSGNIQNWQFILVERKEKRAQLAEAALGQSFVAQAPVSIVVCIDNSNMDIYYGKRGTDMYSFQNSAAAIQNMLLTAHSLGLGTCWVGAFDEHILKRALKIPDDIVPVAIITVGYAMEKPPVPLRRDLDTTVFIEEWGKEE
jgi:nitroreductase